jgi:hypothetical protein
MEPQIRFQARNGAAILWSRIAIATILFVIATGFDGVVMSEGGLTGEENSFPQNHLQSGKAFCRAIGTFLARSLAWG